MINARTLRLFLLMLRVQWRAYLIQVVVLVALFSAAVLRFAFPERFRPVGVPLALYLDLGVTSLFVTGAQRFLESNEGSATALAVTPLETHEYVLGLVLASGVAGTAAGLLLHASVLGIDLRVPSLIAPLFLTTTLAGLMGLALAAYTRDFLRFILACVPLVAVLSLPTLPYFGLLPRALFAWLPSDASIFAFAALASPNPSGAVLGVSVVTLVAYNAALFACACHLFRTRIRGRLETA